MTLSSTREAVRDGLLDLAAADPRMVLVCSDSVKVMRADAFIESHPDRYIDVGIAEQNSIGLASGMATCGLHPWVVGYAGFITMRACEQVRTFVGYPHLNVKMVGANGGIGAGEREGVTHQFIEDVGILRTIPGMTVLVPADANQVRRAIRAAAEVDGPVYIRIGSGRDPVVYDPEEPFVIGKIKVIGTPGDDVAVFANGQVLGRAIAAAARLRDRGIRATVVDVSTIKPLDMEGITAILARTGAAVTVEDHNVIGGLGSAIAEVIAERAPAQLVRVGVQDVFAESGPSSDLLDKYHMAAEDIVYAAVAAMTPRQPDSIPARWFSERRSE